MHPDKIGPYLIDRKIGSGGMGNVYHGVHEVTAQAVAVKVLPASMAREEGFVIRFSREIESLRKLSCDYIVKLFQDGQTDDGSYYYSMEFVDGETLTAMVSRRKKIPWQEVIEISLEIAKALKAAHDAGIVHRDLKPSNLMVAQDGHIKLTDFGVAHMFATTRLTRTGGVVGTAEYMSPEQSRGQRATKHSDLYSLGAVMYVMLTGRPPFTGKMASEILHQHQFSQFDRPRHYVPEIPQLLEDFVCTLLEKKPDRRYPDALVAIKQLQNIRGRIEFKAKAESETVHRPEDPASDHTSGGTSDKTMGSADDAGSSQHQPGPATMVRNILREDIEAQLHKSPIGKFLDNTWVLIALFALVIAAGYYLSRVSIPDPSEELVRAQQMLEAPAGPAWLRARDIIEPILLEDALPESRRKMQQWVRMVNQYEFCHRLNVTAPSDASRESELQRLVRNAFDRYGEGDLAPAIEQLNAVRDVIRDDQAYSYMSQFLKTTLEDWGNEQNLLGRQNLLNSIATHASVLMKKNPGSAQAESKLRAAILLYGDDASVAAEVDKCRQLLSQIIEDL